MVSISGWFDVYANPKLATYGVRVDLASCQPIAYGYCQFGLVVHTTENENKSSSLLLSRLVRWYFMKLEHRRVHCSGACHLKDCITTSFKSSNIPGDKWLRGGGSESRVFNRLFLLYSVNELW